jgi:hypothetical protein
MKGVDTVPAIRNGRFPVLPHEAVDPGIRLLDRVGARASARCPEDLAHLVGTPSRTNWLGGPPSDRWGRTDRTEPRAEGS